jgi:hypothetical protein
VSLTPAANGKNLQSKKFYLFFGAPFGSRVTILIHFFLQVHFKVSDIVSIVCHRCQRWQFAAGVVDSGGKFANGIFCSTIECEKTEIKFID